MVGSYSADATSSDLFSLPSSVEVEWGRHRNAGDPARIGSQSIALKALLEASE